MSSLRIVPVCSVCGRVHLRRGERDAWAARPDLLARTDAQLSHGYCPRCVSEALAELRRHQHAA